MAILWKCRFKDVFSTTPIWWCCFLRSRLHHQVFVGVPVFCCKKTGWQNLKKSPSNFGPQPLPLPVEEFIFCGMPTHSQLWLHHYQLEFLVIRVVECASRCRLTRKVPGKPNEISWNMVAMVAGRWPRGGDASPRTLAARLKLKPPPQFCSEGGGPPGLTNSSFRTKLQSYSPRCAKLPGDLSWLNPPGWPFRRQRASCKGSKNLPNLSYSFVGVSKLGQIAQIWGRFPIWLIFFRWIETTNQLKANLVKGLYIDLCKETVPSIFAYCRFILHYVFHFDNHPCSTTPISLRFGVSPPIFHMANPWRITPLCTAVVS